MSAEPEPYGYYWNEQDPPIVRQVAISWEELALRVATGDSREQAHFLNLFARFLVKNCGSNAKTQTQLCCIGADGLLDSLAAGMLKDIVAFYEDRDR